MLSKLRIIAENFEFVFDSKKNNKRMLRFTWSIMMEHPIAGELGCSVDGCLAQKNGKGEIYWNPPLNYMKGRAARTQLHRMSPAMYKSVLESIKKSKYSDKLDIPLELNNKIKAQDLDSELPEIVEIDLDE